MTLTPTTERFIASWREMVGKWCINRTVAEVHSLAYLSAKPLNAEEVASVLSFSRSNARANLRELESLGLINSVRLRGNRKQYYEAIKDPWEIFRTIIDEQKRRVINPAVATFRACLEEQVRIAPEDSYTAARMREFLSFLEVIDGLFGEIPSTPGAPHEIFLKVTERIREVVE